MINQLVINNFKSIKELNMTCKRINLFIGPPNSGKSNLLESLGVLSYLSYPTRNAHEFLRFERTSDLFYDEVLDEPLEIAADGITFTLRFTNGSFQGTCQGARRTDGMPIASISGDHTDIVASQNVVSQDLQAFKYYRFSNIKDFGDQRSDFLRPLGGDNLVSVLVAHRMIRSAANELLKPFGLVIKQTEDLIITYPYSLLSETIQRVIFYMSAILRNQNSIVVFEEPEAHAFPYYTKYLAELLALDENSNQYIKLRLYAQSVLPTSTFAEDQRG